MGLGGRNWTPFCVGLCMAAINADISAQSVTLMDEVTVTGTREPQPMAETPASVGTIDGAAISELKAGHPGDVMGRIPGVHINVTGGEGHMTAIRQPITTSPVYLYLEDGIPTRSTGFFNHNALYEINLPQANGIEVSKGPGSALYGSDAIGGVVNVLTKPAPGHLEAGVSVEAGGHGWQRLLINGGNGDTEGGYRGDLNLTHTDGWRDDTAYDRQSLTARSDHYLENGAAVKTVISASSIDQQTAGTSRLSKDDYENNPKANYTPISLRKVQAARLSSAYEKESERQLLSITPYARFNSMELIPNWSLSYDPQHYTTENYSLGLLSKYRTDLQALRSRVITGVDVDYSPGRYRENALQVTRQGAIYMDYTEDEKTYDFAATYRGISPYLHLESSVTKNTRITAGLRADFMSYVYDNKMDTVTTGSKRRPESDTVSFQHLSPKLGAAWKLAPQHNTFVSYRHTFRAPSASQLFRQGQTENTVGLKPVIADSVEWGFRGSFWGALKYDVAAYRMTKKDDIVSYRNTTDGTRETRNAGETLHKGVELGLTMQAVDTVSVGMSFSRGKHTYESWSPATGTDYSGNEINSAPRDIGDLRISWRPAVLNDGRIELNWSHLGSYWMDDENTHRYPGHQVYHLRANYKLSKAFELFGRIENLTDERYATGAGYSQFRGEEYAPGMPRTYYAGVSYNWE